MTERQRTLRVLLRSYEDLVDPQQSRGSLGSDDAHGFPLMPPTYTDTVKELERLLRLMRLTDRPLWWQLNERYLKCRRVQRKITQTVPGRRGKKTKVDVWVILQTWDRQVDCCKTEACGACKVCQGVVWLDTHWRLRHEPMLPQELAA